MVVQTPYNTIISTRLSVAVMPFARRVNTGGLSAKVAPEPPSVRPFQAGRKGATASRVDQALYGRNKPSIFTTKPKESRRLNICQG